MNKVLTKIAKKVLTMPKVMQYFKMIRTFYDEKIEVGDLEWLNIAEEGSRFYRTLESGLLDMGHDECTEAHGNALEKLVQMVLRENIMIVEVGSWKGYSTSVLAKSVADYHGSVFAIDHWLGGEETTKHDYAKKVDVYSIFKHNMIVLGVWDIVHPLVMDSLTASQIFADGILDLIFIDADHRYEPFKKDVSAWLPKLRDGGILCGHDCHGYYLEYPEELRKMIDEHLGDEGIPLGCPGVIKGVYECFQEEYSIMPNSTIWYYVKKNTG